MSDVRASLNVSNGPTGVLGGSFKNGFTSEKAGDAT
jgi:hypothetical protein